MNTKGYGNLKMRWDHIVPNTMEGLNWILILSILRSIFILIKEDSNGTLKEFAIILQNKSRDLYFDYL